MSKLCVLGIVLATSVIGCVAEPAEEDEQPAEEARDYTGAAVGGVLGTVGGAYLGRTFGLGNPWGGVIGGAYFGAMLSRYGYEHWQLGGFWDHLPSGPYLPWGIPGGSPNHASTGPGTFGDGDGDLYNGGYYASTPGSTGGSTLGTFGTIGSGIGSFGEPGDSDG